MCSCTVTRSRYCVLVVDDREQLRDQVADLLKSSEQYRICWEADDAAGTLAHLSCEHPDLLLVDLSLERGDGLSLIHHVRNSYPEVPLVALSLYGDELFAERALRAGADAYVLEKAMASDLLKAFEEVLRGKVFVSPEVHDRILQKLRGQDRANDGDGVRSLSDRELEIFNLFGLETNSQAIASRLGLSVKTVETHRSHIKRKLGCKNNQQLSQRAQLWVGHGNLPAASSP